MSNQENGTQAYYENNAWSFIERTLYLDMGEHYQRFLSKFRKAGRVLDAGCGSGRDAYAFKRLGYQVDAFDSSAEMVKSARKLVGIDVQQTTFQAFKSEPVYDAIWAYASLLHVPYAELPLALRNLSAALKTGGILFASFKLGDGEVTREDGRLFSMMTEERFRSILQDVPDLRLEEARITLRNKPTLSEEKWLILIALKTGGKPRN
ncbi:SAM-dependent methyltransferase [Pseudovibrio japonicus]|uniref:SAM-dependent methyltransferase n=1 Tax=Pseudovibrio japonicus TaxID=366534 RepID=A0ABQ3EAE4_9HYPH|nr:class I SAM-dependent methyltransferase [Pseudovibrio japonicus]GHB24384.1 SAM-dependent methyltransferase [Pseudovibrio japonicus]